MTVVAHRLGCCQRGCPAAAHGRDPAGCALRLTGACVGCDCPGGYPPPVAMVWDRRVGWRVIYDVVPDLGEWGEGSPGWAIRNRQQYGADLG